MEKNTSNNCQISEHCCPVASFTVATRAEESQGFLWNRNSGFVYCYWSSV